MLLASKHKHEKIVWGLLAYALGETMTPLEQQAYLQEVKEDPLTEIYLYRPSEQENFIGAMVVKFEKTDQEGARDVLSISLLAVLPSYRNEGVGYEMFSLLKALYPHTLIQGSLAMSELVKNWSVKYRQEQSSDL